MEEAKAVQTSIRQGYFKVPNDVFGDKGEPGWPRALGAIGFLIYALILRRNNNRRSAPMYESQESMATTLGITVPTLEKYLTVLVNRGLVERTNYGKRKHKMWVYQPCFPVPRCSCANESGGEQTQNDTEENTQEDSVKNGGIPKPEGNNTKNGENGQIANPKKSKADNSGSDPPKRTIKRTKINKSPEEQVTYVLEHESDVPLRTQVQAAWTWWGYRWEEHYGRLYYAAQSETTSVSIARDKRNLRDKINVMGFREVIERMNRCFEICDTTFPCYIRGEFVRAVTLNNFVNNHFFDQWVVPATDGPALREPTDPDEAVREEERRLAERKRRRAQESEGDNACGTG